MNRRNLLKLFPLSFIESKEVEPFITNCHTTPDILGSFYIPNAPMTMQLATAGSPGTPLFITGTVYANDTSIPIDPWASDPDAAARIIPLGTDANDNLHGVADIFLDVEAIIDPVSEAEKASKSHIKSIYPNPIKSTGNVEVFLKEGGMIRLELLDLHGHQVSILMEEQKSPGSFTFSFLPQDRHGLKLQNGIFVLRLLQNGIAIAVKRLMVM